MTPRRDLKRRLRDRQAQTGESYTTALRHVQAQVHDLDAEPRPPDLGRRAGRAGRAGRAVRGDRPARAGGDGARPGGPAPPSAMPCSRSAERCTDPNSRRRPASACCTSASAPATTPRSSPTSTRPPGSSATRPIRGSPSGRAPTSRRGRRPPRSPATPALDSRFDAIFINAGCTYARPEWLGTRNGDAPRGRQGLRPGAALHPLLWPGRLRGLGAQGAGMG